MCAFQIIGVHTMLYGHCTGTAQPVRSPQTDTAQSLYSHTPTLMSGHIHAHVRAQGCSELLDSLHAQPRTVAVAWSDLRSCDHAAFELAVFGRRIAHSKLEQRPGGKRTAGVVLSAAAVGVVGTLVAAYWSSGDGCGLTGC